MVLLRILKEPHPRGFGDGHLLFRVASGINYEVAYRPGQDSRQQELLGSSATQVGAQRDLLSVPFACRDGDTEAYGSRTLPEKTEG